MAAKTAQMPEAFNMPTAANNNASLQISLPQMLDLALGTPEVGAVNFNILHNFLHILLQQINLQAATVEFHGENADRIKRMITSMKSKPEVVQRVRRDDGEDADILTEDIQVPAETILRVTEDVKPQINFEKVPEAQMVVSVVNDSPLTVSQFKELEQSVKQLQDQYQALEDLSTSPEIERLKDRIADPAADVWQFSNINKRLDANEQGIDKLTTMVQDVIKGDAGVVTADTSLINTRLDELEDKVSKMEQWLTNLQAVIDMLTEDVAAPTTGITAVEVKEEAEAAIAAAAGAAIAAAAEPVETKDVIVPERGKEENAKEVAKIRRVTPEKLAARVGLMNDTAIEEIRQDVTALKTDVARIQQELQDLNERVAQEKPVAPSAQEIESIVGELIKEKEKIIEVTDVTNLEQCLEAVKNVEAIHGEALNDVTQRVVVLESEFRHLLEKVNSIQEVDKTDNAEINNLITKVQEIETDMEKIGQTMSKLLEDKEKKEAHINTLLQQIEVLKTVKANKEDIEDALADKADAQTVNRKVSHDQFDAACDDLARGLEKAIDKLTKQESIWQQALDEVQNEIATKMDKVEMMPLKEFVNDKLKSLQEKLKIMVEARREIEAAGTKKLLKDVQCISCDKDVVMKTEEIGRFRTEPFPCTISMKPYLTYELDQVRKQQRRLPHSRNLIQFEAAMQEETKKMKAKEEMFARSPRDHLCNRYCGGSHTVTTPQQRVMRTGHFLTQWGPETIQLTDGLIKGKDGQMYRSRFVPGKSDICGPSCWEGQFIEETEHSECSTMPSKPVPF
ncbi:PREDICTED: glutamine-rich protein 2-like isoform X2 [Trachymyrmex cornetzi]|uniref:glutamine-rich protein 2-like isoform X2 n=1 Tax=Trachymyrmex cornetzi TaxID=471704 RepID=UPI00084EFA33|nr:PREDICTED: glutamine-rich protein 2-like isoform X2 [Trachymyrmex cornetzi]